ncbi:hypothetical protein SGPA1_60076 [Streptomyces misionensis JCM 4497]
MQLRAGGHLQPRRPGLPGVPLPHLGPGQRRQQGPPAGVGVRLLADRRRPQGRGHDDPRRRHHRDLVRRDGRQEAPDRPGDGRRRPDRRRPAVHRRQAALRLRQERPHVGRREADPRGRAAPLHVRPPEEGRHPRRGRTLGQGPPGRHAGRRHRLLQVGPRARPDPNGRA